jgi:DNA-damage-inducible protein J
MAETALVQTEVDIVVKERAAAVLGELGMTVSEAVEIFLMRTAEEGALPFKVADDSASHDAWFCAQVQEALNDPRPSLPNDIVESEFSQRRAAVLSKLR